MFNARHSMSLLLVLFFLYMPAAVFGWSAQVEITNNCQYPANMVVTNYDGSTIPLSTIQPGSAGSAYLCDTGLCTGLFGTAFTYNWSIEGSFDNPNGECSSYGPTPQSFDVGFSDVGTTTDSVSVSCNCESAPDTPPERTYPVACDYNDYDDYECAQPDPPSPSCDCDTGDYCEDYVDYCPSPPPPEPKPVPKPQPTPVPEPPVEPDPIPQPGPTPYTPMVTESPPPKKKTPIAGIVGGLIAGMAVIGGSIAGFIVYKRHKRAKNNTDDDSDDGALKKKKPDDDSIIVEIPPTRPEQSMINLEDSRIHVTDSEDDAPASPTMRAIPEDSAVEEEERPPTMPDPLLSYIQSQPLSAWNFALDSSGRIMNESPSSARSNQSPSTRQKAWDYWHQQVRGGVADIRNWQFQFEELEISQPIGSGSFGRVYLAMKNSTPVAVKILIEVNRASQGSSETAAQITQEKLIEEVSMTAGLDHPNIVGFRGFCAAPPCIALELCTRGSVYQWLQAASTSDSARQQLNWKRRLQMAIDTAKGMHYLHCRKPQIIHRDLKSGNLLLAADWTVKVSDFNLSKIVEEITHGSSAMASTAGGPSNPRWLAPEILQNKRATAASDAYSNGNVLWELMTFQLPWIHLGTSPWSIVQAVMAGEHLPIPPREEIHDADGFKDLDKYIELMKRCWNPVPSLRPSFQEIVRVLQSLELE